MAYVTPKTNWVASDGPTETDLNRIENNIATLATLRGYATAGGTATAITVTTGNFELTAGRAFTFVCNGNNNGAATTINADGTGAKNLYKPNTTDAPNLISGKAYTVWYNGTSFFVKASAEGDAVAGDVIKNKTFSSDADTGITGTLELTGSAAVGDVLATKTFYNTNPQSQATGTMTNNGTVSTDISAKATEVTIAQGYHSGSGKVKIATAEQNKIITGNIKAGVTILGVAGKTEVVDTSSGDAVAGDILNGKKAWVDGSEVTGTLNKATITAGYFMVATSVAEANTKETSYTKVKEARVYITGTYKVIFILRGTGLGYTSSAQIYKNGSAYGTERINTSAFEKIYEEDLSFTANDYIQIYAKVDNAIATTYISYFLVGVTSGFSTAYIAEII